jgi:hypothetical protein
MVQALTIKQQTKTSEDQMNVASFFFSLGIFLGMVSGIRIFIRLQQQLYERRLPWTMSGKPLVGKALKGRAVYDFLGLIVAVIVINIALYFLR